MTSIVSNEVITNYAQIILYFFVIKRDVIECLYLLMSYNMITSPAWICRGSGIGREQRYDVKKLARVKLWSHSNDVNVWDILNIGGQFVSASLQKAKQLRVPAANVNKGCGTRGSRMLHPLLSVVSIRVLSAYVWLPATEGSRRCSSSIDGWSVQYR